MLGSLSILLCLFFGYFIQTKKIESLLNLLLIINFIYVLNGIKIQGISITIKNIFYGEIIHSLIYIAWLKYFCKYSYIYFIPLFLSTLCKIYIVLTFTKIKQKLDETFVQETILFQTKTQVFILGYLLLSLLFGQRLQIISQFLTYIMVCVIKYNLHHRSQLAYRQLHFGIDNCLKRTKFRSFYQVIYKIILICGILTAGQKSFTY